MELSLNTYEKTEEQKKRLSESIFNSTITENNTPINAIRRVVVKKKKKPKVSAPGINGVIHEDPDGEDEEYEEVEVVRDPDLYQQQPGLEDRNDAQVSSEGEQQRVAQGPGSYPQPGLAGPASDDSDDDKKDAKKKDKKKKKDDKPKGYNEEELKRGTKLMANPSFKNNLDRLNRLKSQFKEKTVASGHPAPSTSTSAGSLKLKLRAQPEETAPKRDAGLQGDMQESRVIQQEEYRFAPAEEPRGEFQPERGSDIKLGDRDQPPGFGENGPSAFAGKSLKDSLRGPKKDVLLTPNVNPDPLPAPKKPEPQPPRPVADKGAPQKQRQAPAEERQPHRRGSEEDFDVQVEDSRPSQSSKPQPSTKDSSNPREDWEAEPVGSRDPQPKKISVPTKQSGLTVGRPGLSLSTAQKKLTSKAPKADGSDNSWDEDKNPYK